MMRWFSAAMLVFSAIWSLNCRIVIWSGEGRGGVVREYTYMQKPLDFWPQPQKTYLIVDAEFVGARI